MIRIAMTMFLASAGAAHADVFIASSGNDRLTLTCEGTALVDTSCRIEMGKGASGEAMPVRFATQPTRYVHLLKLGIEKAVGNRQSSFRLDASDIPLVRGLALDKCHPDADYFGDMFQLCLPAGSSASVVLFVRGLCDRCDFEPVVLKKQAGPR